LVVRNAKNHFSSEDITMRKQIILLFTIFLTASMVANADSYGITGLQGQRNGITGLQGERKGLQELEYRLSEIER